MKFDIQKKQEHTLNLYPSDIMALIKKEIPNLPADAVIKIRGVSEWFKVQKDGKPVAKITWTI